MWGGRLGHSLSGAQQGATGARVVRPHVFISIDSNEQISGGQVQILLDKKDYSWKIIAKNLFSLIEFCNEP